MLFRDMGGAEFEGGRRGDCLRRFGGLVISVPDSESSVTGSNLGPCGDISSRNVNHEKVRDIRSALRESGIGVHEELRDILALANLELFPCI